MPAMYLLESERGERYVESFIRSLSKPVKAKVFRTIDLLEEHGSYLGMPHSKYLGEGLFELRVRGKVEVRIFYIFKREAIYLIHAFQKKSQKTPKREILLAKSRYRNL